MVLAKLNFQLGNPKMLLNSQPRWKDGGNFRAMDRRVLREAFGNMAYRTNDGKPPTYALENNRSKTTPFRTAMNAGDINGTVNKSVDKNALPKPANQVHVKNSFGWKLFAGSVQTEQSGGAFYSGNPKHVYDGADYVRFKKLQAMNRNYNDPTFGGDDHNASQVALKNSRR